MYDELSRLRDDLIALKGMEHWASELLAAERSATTSGEAISNISPILRRLREADGTGAVRARVDGLLAFMDRAWNASNS